MGYQNSKQKLEKDFEQIINQITDIMNDLKKQLERKMDKKFQKYVKLNQEVISKIDIFKQMSGADSTTNQYLTFSPISKSYLQKTNDEMFGEIKSIGNDLNQKSTHPLYQELVATQFF